MLAKSISITVTGKSLSLSSFILSRFLIGVEADGGGKMFMASYMSFCVPTNLVSSCAQHKTKFC